MNELTAREALEIAHAYGLTLRQFGPEIRACLADRRANPHPTKSPARAFACDMEQVAHESGCAHLQSAYLFSQEAA